MTEEVAPHYLFPADRRKRAIPSLSCSRGCTEWMMWPPVGRPGSCSGLVLRVGRAPRDGPGSAVDGVAITGRGAPSPLGRQPAATPAPGAPRPAA